MNGSTTSPSRRGASRAGPAAVMAAVAALAGCGIDLESALVVDDLAESIVLASVEDIAAGDVLEGSYIVAFRGDAGATRRGFASYLSEYQFHYEPLAEAYLTDPRVVDIQYITGVDLANPKDASAAEADWSPPPALRLAWNEDALAEVPAVLARVDFATPDDAATTLKEWHAARRIWFAEPNHANRLSQGEEEEPADGGAEEPADGGGGGTGGNPFSGISGNYTAWWHAAIKLPAALDALAGRDLPSANVPVIAVLDSGVDTAHPSLEGRIWINNKPGASGCPGDVNGCDTTQAKKGQVGTGAINPYLTKAHGEACPDSTDGKKVCPHGTHVAGIIASAADGSGIGGVCPVCQVMPIKIIQTVKGRGAALDSAILNGFKYITLFRDKQNIVRVANSSFGQYIRARSIGLLVSILKKAPNEVLVVGAAGNEDTMARQYPAAFSDAIAVAATGQNDGKAEYSNFGPWVDIAAPGGDATTGQQITSTMPGGLPGDKQGTSMAAPVVAGVAGLILAVDPGRSFQKLRSSLIKTADPRLYNADTAGGFNRQYYYPKVGGESSPRPLLGSGIVDAPAAIENTANTGRVVSNLGRVSRGCSVVASDSSPSAWAGPSSPAASAGPSSPAAWAGPSSPAAWAGPSSPAASGGVGDLFLLFLMLLAPVVISSHRIIKRRAGHSQWRR